MAGCRAASSHSGMGALTGGVVGETLRSPTARRDHRAPSAGGTPTWMATGDGSGCEVLPGRGLSSPQLTGAMPRPSAGAGHQQVCIPGYAGHIAGKVAENLHGGTFRAENERATHALPFRQMRRSSSDPQFLASTTSSFFDSPGRRLSVAPRVPGYAGTIPGKLAGSVHGMRFAEANEMAQSLRSYNPVASSDGWLRRGRWPSDRMVANKWVHKSLASSAGSLFSEEQEQEACELSRHLGETFGLKPPKKNPYQPGDRFLHHKLRVKTHQDNSVVQPAG